MKFLKVGRENEQRKIIAYNHTLLNGVYETADVAYVP